jgi:enoyl-CoA hydratase/carnithine racemase
MDGSRVRIDRSGVVATLTLDRAERRNALSLELMTELTAALRDVGADPGTHAVVIAAEGPAFSAGHDMAEMVGREHAFYEKLFDVCTVMMKAIHEIPQPVVAKVQGVATAAGCQLVAACDLVVASADAVFATPGVKIGLFCSTPMVPISRAVGRKRAMQMLLTGEPIDAATAQSWGLVNEVVPAEDLDGAVDDLVARITQFSPVTIGIGKKAFYSQIDMTESAAYDHTREVMATNAAIADAQEGISAFLEKRTPKWSERD